MKKTRSLCLSTAFLLLILCFATTAFSLPLGLGGITKADPPAEQPVKGQAENQVVDKNLADLMPKATELAKKLLEMQSQLSTMQETDEVVDGLQDVSEKRNLLIEQLHALQIDPQGNQQQLTELQSQMRAADLSAATVSKRLDGSITVLDSWLDFWSAEEKGLALWQEGLGSSSSLPAVQQVLGRLQEMVNQARQAVDSELLPLLALQKKGSDLQLSLHKLNLRVDELFKSRFQHGLSHHAPFLFSTAFIAQFNSELLHQSRKGIQKVAQPDFVFLKAKKLNISLSLLFFIILTVILYAGRDSLKRSGRSRFSTQRPVAFALFISLFFFPLLIQAQLPPFWIALVRALFLISIIRMSRSIAADTLQKKTITRLALLMLVTDLLVMFNLPLPVMRVYVFAVVVCCLALFALYRLRSTKRKIQQGKMPTWFVWGMRLGFFTLIIILLAEINGQAELAFFVFSASLKTLFEVLLVWIIYLILVGTVGVSLHYAPFQLLRTNIDSFIKMVRPLLLVGSILTLLSSSLVIWRVFPSFPAALEYLISLGITTSTTRITFGMFLSGAFLLYGAFCCSKIVQTTLVQSVFPRQRLDKGIQLSITRLLHYAIMVLGGLMALAALGFSLTNLTIIGGALSVGLGFGLQEIVKNFASGLILLFERPIKVGDTIQVGTDLAEVKELGLRATVVQTANNAEIVIPNADLVTGQVTNWTLQERQVRIKAPVGVAYGSDVEQVLRILITCAEEHPEVLSTPEPGALFLAFGASSLDFELRAFIADFSGRRRILSELNQIINSEFEDAGLEIPFPQSDLHLRSVDPKAAGLLKGKE